MLLLEQLQLLMLMQSGCMTAAHCPQLAASRM
jgi:hypothetical protein